MKINNVLVSLYDKNGIEPLLEMFKKFNSTVYTTSSTHEYIISKGYKAKKTEEITGISSILGGRVKTLNTNLFAGILARPGIDGVDDIPVLFDMVIVDLYPFEKSYNSPGGLTDDLNRMIELIDIGGISLIRAAAKNFRYVCCLADKENYIEALNEMENSSGEISEEFSRRMAQRAFEISSSYDNSISEYFSKINGESDFRMNLRISAVKETDLRYGENPHQKAALYRIRGSQTPISSLQVIHGKEMSYNNYMDLDSAVSIAYSFGEPAAAIIKHTNPCGTGRGDTIEEAYELAFMADPQSAYGGIIALNRTCSETAAEMISNTFFEIVYAPDFEDGALELLMKKKNLRIVKGEMKIVPALEFRHITGALLVQDKDNISDPESMFRVVTDREPNEREYSSMLFGWNVCRHVKSNAIVISIPNRTMGVGAGQMSRIDSVEIAIRKSGGMAAYTGGSALASDAYIPFRDSIDAAYKAGVYAIIQPGGSIRDHEVIDACNEHDMAMIFTGRRHFKH